VRLYLSSFRVGNCPDRLISLAHDGLRTAVIGNAMDGASREVRLAAVERELTALADIGLDPEELDLRELSPATVTDELERYDIVWLRGGNVFVLRSALAASAADIELKRRLKTDSIVYAGYSAGPCVLGPSLDGLEVVDEPEMVEAAYGRPPTWDGLGVLDFSIVPHFESPEHPESAALGRVAEAYRRAGTPHRTLRDGEVLVIEGTNEFTCA
jgi:dipeptidase E